MNKILCVLTLLLINPLLTESLEKLMLDATKYNSNREFEKAYHCSTKALKLAPNHPYAYFYIGDYYGSIGEYKIAIEYYDKAIKHHTTGVFPLAHYQKAITNLVTIQDLSYCTDINILENHFTKDDTYLYLKEEHSDVFGLCTISELRTDELVYTANALAEMGHCMYAEIIFNEAKKEGTRYDLGHYDKSLCSK
tara:strand:+ start:125 stop:706 length:582 start_codon:yes stop_codon:yes gene_type:complete